VVLVLAVALVEDQIEHSEYATGALGEHVVRGTRYGIAALAILRLVRNSRCERVGSDTKNARAICAVLRPATVFRVRATRLSMANAG
jgi:hypothetical protein